MYYNYIYASFFDAKSESMSIPSDLGQTAALITWIPVISPAKRIGVLGSWLNSRHAYCAHSALSGELSENGTW